VKRGRVKSGERKKKEERRKKKEALHPVSWSGDRYWRKR
jgi:hypothetical protein